MKGISGVRGPKHTEGCFFWGHWSSLPPGEILAEFLMMTPVFQLALLRAVGHQVTAATPGELLSTAVGTETLPWEG